MRGRRRAIFAVSLGLLAAVCQPVTTATGAPSTDASTWDTATITLANGGIAYDASRDKLLVAVAPSVPTLGNKLIELDPHTGAIGRTVVVGADPRQIAVASDGSRAYVALSGAPAVAEVDLASFTLTRQIVLGTDSSSGPLLASDIDVQPGSPDVIAVSRHGTCCGSHFGVAIFDDGVKRPNVTATHTGAARITWSDDAATLYGFNSLSTAFGFYELTVNANGVTMSSAGKLITGFSSDIEFGDGLVHSTNGQAVDAATLALVGPYAVSGPLEVDEAQHKVFFLNGATLSRADIATRLTDWQRTVPNISPRDLVDANTVLAAAGSASILLMGPGVSSTSFVLPPPPPSMLQTWGQHSATLAVHEIVSAPDGQHVYGVVRSSAAAHAGEVVEVDTTTGAIGRALFVGADPHRIAISDDGSTLMIGHNEANQLTEVDVGTFTATRTVNLPAGEWADDIAPRPGNPGSFAVVVFNHCCSPRLEGTILVEDGVIRPNRAPGHTGATSITFTGDPSRLYGFNAGTTEHGFYTMAVDANGITVLSSVRSFLPLHAELVSTGGRVYTSKGATIEPTIPLQLGDVEGGGLPVPVPSNDRFLLVGSTTINEFDLDSYSTVGSWAFSGGSAVDAVLAGSQLAIATSGGQIVFVPLGPDLRMPPGAPSNVTADAGDAKAVVSWLALTDDGGSAITSYNVTSSPGGMTCITSGTTCTVTGLANGTSYTFTVSATNAKGSGPPSLQSNAVTPVGKPGAPTGLSATSDNGAVALTWLAPASTGGTPITSYTVTASPGGATCNSSGSSCSVSGLTNGLPYTFVVRATNAAGTGASSLPVGPTMPTSCDGAGEGPFPDVSAAHRFCADIEWAVANAIVSGYSDTTFKPLTGTSRQALTAFVRRYRGEPVFPMPVFPTFTDVPAGHGFSIEIEWAAAESLIDGYADGSFRPIAPVTRQSLAAVLFRLAGSPAFAAPAVATLSDVPTTHPFFTEIEWLIDAGVTTGYSDGTFHPGESITRQALVAFLHRFDQQHLS